MKQPGVNVIADHLWNWEVTIPSVGLPGHALGALQRSAESTQLAAERYGVEHYADIQEVTMCLGASILTRIQTLHDGDDDLLYLGAQLSCGVAQSARTAHTDPPAISAALATLTLEGAATIRLYPWGVSNPARAHSFTCDGSHVYILTGE